MLKSYFLFSRDILKYKTMYLIDIDQQLVEPGRPTYLKDDVLHSKLALVLKLPLLLCTL